MKKLLFAAAVITAMASCSNNEIIDVNPGEGISFRTSLDKATRTTANVTTKENLTQFNVTAIGNSSSYFTNLLVSSTNQGVNWNTAQTYYWPSYELKFFAYAPINDIGTVSIDQNAQTINGFTPASDVAQQKDLLVSCNTGTKDANEGTGVEMNFKHALSQIEIKAKCSNPNIKIEVKGIRIVNPASSGNFTFPNTATQLGYTLPQGNWTDLKGTNNSAYKIKTSSDNVELTNEAKSLMFGENNFMLIPQHLTAWTGKGSTDGAYISVLCRIYSKNGDQYTLLYPQPTTGDNKDNKFGYASVAINTDWQPGKKYIYTLEFCSADTNGNGGGLIDPKPDTEDKDVDPNPKDGSEGGDPVLNGPIKFTVTVDNWVDETKDIIMN